jgi:hypothetical protein
MPSIYSILQYHAVSATIDWKLKVCTLSCINSTFVLAFPNYNTDDSVHKVVGLREWLKVLKYVGCRSNGSSQNLNA